MKRSLSNFEKMGILAMALIAGGFFYFTKIYDPEVKRFEESKVKLENADKKLRSMGNAPIPTQLQKQVKEQTEKVKAIKDRIEAQSSKSQDKAQAQQAIAHIAQLAEEKFLSVASQTFKGTQPNSFVSRTEAISGPQNNIKASDDEFQWYQYELVLRGPYQGLTQLVTAMREADWVAVIGNLRVRSSNETGSVEVTMEILL